MGTVDPIGHYVPHPEKLENLFKLLDFADGLEFDIRERSIGNLPKGEIFELRGELRGELRIVRKFINKLNDMLESEIAK